VIQLTPLKVSTTHGQQQKLTGTQLTNHQLTSSGPAMTAHGSLDPINKKSSSSFQRTLTFMFMRTLITIAVIMKVWTWNLPLLSYSQSYMSVWLTLSGCRWLVLTHIAHYKVNSHGKPQAMKGFGKTSWANVSLKCFRRLSIIFDRKP
jgi:hypothetical protein